MRLCLRIFPLRKGIKKSGDNSDRKIDSNPERHLIAAPQFERYGDSCKRSGGDEIESEEAKRASLCPDFPFKKGNQKKSGDNSDQKIDS
ncbi:hypothetical protein BS614_24835 [Paenibacillus xylanexedens]|nr:hypothetical protein BS614_24835 [Paenibacillus xylanexedens]